MRQYKKLMQTHSSFGRGGTEFEEESEERFIGDFSLANIPIIGDLLNNTM